MSERVGYPTLERPGQRAFAGDKTGAVQVHRTPLQLCEQLLQPLPVHLEVDIAETFGPEGYRDADEAEGAEVPEVFDDNGIDLGELVAQLLLLSLDPYPRSSDADSLQQAGADDVAGERSRPFAGLGAMMQKQRK